MRKHIEAIKKYALLHPVIVQVEICIVLALIVALPCSILLVIGELNYNIKAIEVLGLFLMSMLTCVFVFFILIYPIIVTVYEALLFIVSVIKGSRKNECDEHIKINAVCSMLYDFFIIFVGVILELIVLYCLHTVVFSAHWSMQLTNDELHAPLNKEYAVTFVVISLLYVLGMLVLTLMSGRKRPPLITVLCIAAMYLGVFESVLFTIHILGIHSTQESGAIYSRFGLDLLYTLLIPINMILIMLRTIYIEIKSYEPDKSRSSKIESIPILSWCDKILNNSKSWPFIAIIMMIPILGMVIGVLALFGQAPDAAIKAFTETADYTFSTKIPPQNLYYDEHYLCTVAAGGHKKIVKPIRMGKRHGHDVVVNRQLMIANAFEQILEERTPRLHRAIRDFYDKYGFPIARLIKTKMVADVVWFVMKPLEWFFLIIIYLFDVNPEDRIARQYL